MGFEQPVPGALRPAGLQQSCGLLQGRGRFTFYAPHSSSKIIRCNDGFCFCFYGGYGAIETIAGFADEAVVDFDAHNRFTVNYLFLVDDDFLNQRVNQFLVQLRNIGIQARMLEFVTAGMGEPWLCI